MFSIKRVLFPTDFSSFSNRALEQAVLWCRAYGAELVTLHVYHDDEDTDADALRQEAISTMGEVIEVLGGENLATRHHVFESERVPERIVDTIRDDEVDLVVMGTHSRRGIAAILNRSVAEEVVRTAPCPVLVVPEGETRWPPARILVPVDFSTLSPMAVQYGRAIAAHNDGSVLLLHIVEEIVVPDFYPPAPVAVGAAAQSGTLETAGRQLEILFEAVGGTHVASETHVMSGRASLDIAGFATANDVDLIVMPTHGLSGLSRWFLGSVTERVVRTAACPVLALRPFGSQLIDDLKSVDPALEAPDPVD